jgi:hypothetical protein
MARNLMEGCHRKAESKGLGSAVRTAADVTLCVEHDPTRCRGLADVLGIDENRVPLRNRPGLNYITGR